MPESLPLLGWEGFAPGAEETVRSVVQQGETVVVDPLEWNVPPFAPSYPGTPAGVAMQTPLEILATDKALYYVVVERTRTGFQVKESVRVPGRELHRAEVRTAVRKNNAVRKIMGAHEQVILLTLSRRDVAAETFETRFAEGIGQGEAIAALISKWHSPEPPDPAIDPDALIRCPWCAEEIRAAAKKCKHCGEFLVDGGPDIEAVGPPAPLAPVMVPAPVGPASLVCPHCNTRGRVTTRRVKQKKGLSGGKATAAVLTGGLSILGTGLSRKEELTEARCANCGAVWHF